MVSENQRIYNLLNESYRIAKENYDFVRREKRKADLNRFVDKISKYDPRNLLYRKELTDFTYALNSFVP